jgi:hypothetical protein
MRHPPLGVRHEAALLWAASHPEEKGNRGCRPMQLLHRGLLLRMAVQAGSRRRAERSSGRGPEDGGLGGKPADGQVDSRPPASRRSRSHTPQDLARTSLPRCSQYPKETALPPSNHQIPPAVTKPRLPLRLAVGMFPPATVTRQGVQCGMHTPPLLSAASRGRRAPSVLAPVIPDIPLPRPGSLPPPPEIDWVCGPRSLR